MGSRGPVPKRSSQRRRTNHDSVTEQVKVAVGEVFGEPLGGEHSELAMRFWEGLRRSGQAQFYEPSDWAAGELVVLAIDQFVRKPSAMMLSAIQSGMSDLLVTEGDRRRVRLELERGDGGGEVDPDAAVARLDEYRKRVASGQ